MTLRLRSKVDANQPKLVAQIRKLGATVKVVSQLKRFCDIVVGYQGKNYLIEIKDPDKPPSQRKLTPDEIDFHMEWEGQIDVVHTIEDVIKILEN